MATNIEVRSFLDQALSLDSNDAKGKTHVTLTFAQSIDGKIAGIGGRQLILSGKESMLMTHRQVFKSFICA